MLQNNQKINWKQVTVKVTALDGVELIGEIQYWAKDFEVRLTHPFSAYGCSSHLQYSVPVIYITAEEPTRRGVISIDLIERAEQFLLSIYEEKKEHLNALDAERLIDDGYFSDKDVSLFTKVCSEWNVSDIDKFILEEKLKWTE